MAPQKVIQLDSLGPISSRVGKNHIKIDEKIDVISLEQQKRITIYHYVVHILAFIIIIPYITLIIYNIPVPISFSTLVSVIIGFYFARNLFN